jgi:two-component system response regulator DesR
MNGSGLMVGSWQMVRLLLVLDLVLFRSALAAALDSQRDLTVAGSCGTADDVAALARAARPDVTVIDLDTHPLARGGVVSSVAAEAPGCTMVAVASFVTRTTMRRALDSRVLGFVSKDSEVDTVRRVAAGERVIDPATAITAVARADNPLTPRELEVLRLAADGTPPAEIADRLYLSAGTVRNYLSTIVQKLGVRGRMEAIRTAERAGWLWS